MTKLLNNKTLCKPLTFDGSIWHPQWFVGFVDGDGHFSKSRDKSTYRYRFIVSQDKSSVAVLYAFQAFFKCGFVHKAGGNMMEYSVGNSQDIADIIIPFFETHTLKTQHKFNQFQIWRKEFLLNRDLKSTDIVFNTTLNTHWLSGFIDAEGCFYVGLCKSARMKVGYLTLPKFFISQNDKILCEKIIEYIKGGRCRSYKNSYILEVSALKDHSSLINLLSPTNLHTKKKESYIIWCKIIDIIKKKEHLTEEGLCLIRSFLSRLNKF